MRDTVPFSIVVPIGLADGSTSASLSIGNLSVDQITQDEAPGLLEISFFAVSSIFTTARPAASCPVTTRRICRLIGRPFLGSWDVVRNLNRRTVQRCGGLGVVRGPDPAFRLGGAADRRSPRRR